MIWRTIHICAPLWGGVANATPLYVATPTFNSHAHQDFSMILVDFFIDRSRIGLLGSKQRDEAFVGVALWAWPFVGMALSNKASYGFAHKGLIPFLGAQKANSWSIDKKIQRTLSINGLTIILTDAWPTFGAQKKVFPNFSPAVGFYSVKKTENSPFNVPLKIAKKPINFQPNYWKKGP